MDKDRSIGDRIEAVNMSPECCEILFIPLPLEMVDKTDRRSICHGKKPLLGEGAVINGKVRPLVEQSSIFGTDVYKRQIMP